MKDPSSTQTKSGKDERPSQNFRPRYSTAQSQSSGSSPRPKRKFQPSQRASPSTSESQLRTSFVPTPAYGIERQPQTRQNSPRRAEDLKAKIQQTVKATPPKPKLKLKPEEPNFTSPKNAANSHLAWKAAQAARKDVRSESIEQSHSQPAFQPSPKPITSSDLSRQNSDGEASRMCLKPAADEPSGSSNPSGLVDRLTHTKIEDWADDVESQSH